ncbi:MAG: hypothetical protein IH899_13125 [Planctomycetes bacterium]|nr:hypothetical protein [Planctomycetota bacterium]
MSAVRQGGETRWRAAAKRKNETNREHPLQLDSIRIIRRPLLPMRLKFPKSPTGSLRQ